MSFTIWVPPIPFPLTIPQVVQALQDAQSTRYLSVIGFVILVYDHLLTFGDEVQLVWAAPRSFAKYAYLFNRYLVMACLFAVTHEMCGFAGSVYTSEGCRHFLSTVCILSLCSIALANILILLRVVLLWDHRPIIFRLLTAGFIASFTAQATLMVMTLLELWPGVFWVPAPIGMCITTFTTRKLIGVWAAPMFFEVLVLLTTILNAFDRPHQARFHITKALYRDGVFYFCAVTTFRVLNLAFAIVGTPSTSMLSVFFAWAVITTVLCRSLLGMRKQELKSDVYTPSGRASPFGFRAEADMVEIESQISPARLQLSKMRSESR